MAEHVDSNAVPRRLVFVHGIGAHPYREDTRTAWIKALALGMERAGHPEVAKKLHDRVHEVHLAHYADLYRPPGAQGSTEPKLDGTEAELLIQLIDELIINVDKMNPEIGERYRHTLDRARDELRPPTDGTQGAGQMLQFAFTAMLSLSDVPIFRTAFQTAESFFMVSHLRQVTRYLRRGEPDEQGHTLDRRIRARVVEAIAEQPAIVVAHSLGSIVAYETLHESNHMIPMLVTLGSPLGMPVVRPRLRPTPPASPSGVAEWLNVWDRDDPIAVGPDLQNWIGSNCAGVLPRSIRIKSTKGITHAATRYLTHADVGGHIAHATCQR